MQLKTIPLYSYDELSKDIQNDLVEEVADKRGRHFDGYPIIEGFVEDMEKYGLSDVDVNWSGFGSQGDGACFTANICFLTCCSILYKYNTDFTKLLHRVRENVYDVSAKVVRCGQKNHYVHENTCKVVLSSENLDDMTEAILDSLEELENKLTEWVRSECRSLHDMIQSYYFEQQDASVIAEDLNALGEIYTETGQIIDLD